MLDSESEGIRNLNRHPASLGTEHLDRGKILNHPVRLGGDDLLDRMARHKPENLAPSRLSRANSGRAVLEHEDLSILALEAETLAAEAIACGVWLPSLDRLGCDETIRRRCGQVSSTEPSSYEGYSTGGDDRPGTGLGDESLEHRPGARDLDSFMAVVLGESTFHLPHVWQEISKLPAAVVPWAEPSQPGGVD